MICLSLALRLQREWATMAINSIPFQRGLRLFDRVELIDSTNRPAFAQRPKRPWEWGGGDDGSQLSAWDEPSFSSEAPVRPNYAPRLGTTKSVWKSKPSTVFKKKPPQSSSSDPTYVDEPF